MPFEALPVPHAAQNALSRNFRLIDTNEVSTIPSVSTLIALRATKIQRSPLHVAAVIADPVFSLSDDRVPSNWQFATIATASAAPVRHPIEIALARFRVAAQKFGTPIPFL